jgi:MFS family permease
MKEAGYKNYLLTLLLVILAFNYVDRLALGLVLQNIKTDLDLSDTQLGFLSGLAFAVFYSLMGIPIARWADRGNRVRIIWITAALWSVMVALCGMAGNFAQLLLIRVGVAVGEAGCIPPAYSLIADYFNRAERPRAVSIYLLGGPLSFVIGYFLAGWLNEMYGWRLTFIFLGLPGLALSLLAWGTLREPRNKAPNTRTRIESPSLGEGQISALPTTPASLKVVCLTLWSNVTFRHLLLSFSIASFFASGILQWQPAFFVRSYGLKTGELGTWFAVVYGLGGLLGTFLGGELASRYAAFNERLQLKGMAIVYCCYGGLSPLVYISPNYYVAFALLGLGVVVGTATNGPLFSTIQALVPQRMQAMSIAIIYLFANLIGGGLGPFAAGALSDALRPALGEESLRYSLLALCPGYFWAGWHLWRANKSVTHDVDAMEVARGLTP